jgi:putative ABC transport system permease protein
MNIFKMAWRNVWRYRRRSLVTIAAMAFALFVELVYSGGIPGYMKGMEEDVTDLDLGDIQVFSKDFQDNPSLWSRVDDPDALLARLDAAGLPATARLLGGGLGASGNFSAGVALRGIDVQRETRVSKIAEKVQNGTWLDPADPKGVVIGRQLAKTLDAKPGSELVILTQAADGSMANDLFEIRGVLFGIAEGTDRAAVYMLADTFRQLMVFPSGAHQIVVRRDGKGLDEAAATVRGIVAADPALSAQVDVKTWKQLSPIVAQMLDGSRGIMYILFFVIYVAVGILILNAMLMAVFERIREFGVFKAIGAGPFRVLGLIAVESAIQIAVAMVVGFGAAIPAMFYFEKYGINVGILAGVDMMGVASRPVWYGIYTPDVVLGPVILLWFIGGLAAAYPAMKAAWIDPIRAIHHQ